MNVVCKKIKTKENEIITHLFPNEIWHLIFEVMGVFKDRDILRSVLLTCKLFRQIVLESTKWSKQFPLLNRENYSKLTTDIHMEMMFPDQEQKEAMIIISKDQIQKFKVFLLNVQKFTENITLVVKNKKLVIVHAEDGMSVTKITFSPKQIKKYKNNNLFYTFNLEFTKILPLSLDTLMIVFYERKVKSTYFIDNMHQIINDELPIEHTESSLGIEILKFVSINSCICEFMVPYKVTSLFKNGGISIGNLIDGKLQLRIQFSHRTLILSQVKNNSYNQENMSGETFAFINSHLCDYFLRFITSGSFNLKILENDVLLFSSKQNFRAVKIYLKTIKDIDVLL